MDQENRSRIYQVIAVLAVAGGLFAAATAPYWVKQADYALHQPSQNPEPVSAARSGEKGGPDRLTIRRLKIEAPIVYVSEEDEKSFQDGLKEGAVHYPGTADIGKPGNPYIFGHSSDYIWSEGHYKTVFALLPKIKIGDEIAATDREGYVYHYRVMETKVVSPDDTGVLSQQNYERRLLTLQTSYPVGTALRRFVAIAELVN